MNAVSFYFPGSKWAKSFGSLAMGNPDRPELAEEITTAFSDLDPMVARQFAEVTFNSDQRNVLDLVRVPTLILQCTNDVVVPSSASEFLHRSIKESTLARLDATGHFPHLTAPDETIDAIKDYLESDID